MVKIFFFFFLIIPIQPFVILKNGFFGIILTFLFHRWPPVLGQDLGIFLDLKEKMLSSSLGDLQSGRLYNQILLLTF